MKNCPFACFFSESSLRFTLKNFDTKIKFYLFRKCHKNMNPASLEMYFCNFPNNSCC